jgi:predicted transcriptional regulator
LTGLTLFFVELLPKSLGVVNAEVVARLMVPPINMLSTVVSPLGITLSWLSKKTLSMLGVRELSSKSGVSDSQLRLIVTGALDSGTIDHGEQEMIQGVLNLQDQRVKEIMRPRVEMIAVPTTMSVASVLGVVRASGYSRIPVYEGEIDNIVGIVLAKSVLDFFVHGVLFDKENPFTVKGKGAAHAAVVALENEQETDNDTSTTTTAATTDVTNKGEEGHYSTAPIHIEDKHSGDSAISNDRYVRTLTAAELAARMEMTVKEAGASCVFT